ncbi:otolin-1-like [Pecten maximus]|uniref:otolin-1-like n=1 Tax=Pecten maximus TaxID=6579 RepID=UPI001458FD82|nr:otolin-1-like [Pecten maximus]
MVVRVLCPIAAVRGQTLDENDSILKTNRDVISDLQLRLSALEHRRNEDTLRIRELEKQQQTYQSRITILEKQQQTDQRRISDLEEQRQIDQRRISDLENLTDDNQRHATRVEKMQHRGKLNSLHKTIPNTFDNNLTFTMDELHSPSGRKPGVFKMSTLESTNSGKEKRVSDNAGMVAFYAVLSHEIKPITSLMEIHFDKVTTNLGGSYSGNTGTFTCTRAGVYVFSWTVHANPRYVYTELIKNGAVTGKAFSGDSQYSGSGGGSLVLELHQGDEVWVRVHEYAPGTYLFGNFGTTSFSGFLLQ